MLDITFIRNNPKLVKDNERKRDRDESRVDRVLELDAQWRERLQGYQDLLHKRNVVSQEINARKKAGESADEQIASMKAVVAEIKTEEGAVNDLLAKRNRELFELGNIMHPEVKKGKDESENVELRTWGEKKDFSFQVKNHVELLDELGLADFDASAETSGKGFYFLKGSMALLNQALIRFTVDFMHAKGYTYIEPPLMLREEVLSAAIDTGEWENTIYRVQDENLALIGTSEHALLGMHAQHKFIEDEMPKRYTSYSMCFRREVGAHGINERGLWRTHQFNKIEQFVFCLPEESDAFFFELLENTEALLQALELPYRVLDLCSGDLSLWKQRSYDLEVWRPTTGEYGEVASLSNCTDYQARKLNIRVARKDGTKQVVHTLNNTAVATSRIMVAILEHYQREDGSVGVPTALLPYMQGITELRKAQ